MIESILIHSYYHIKCHYIQAQLCIISLALIYYLIILPISSPLYKVPGPYLHRISYFPALNSQRNGTWIKKVYSLHQKYGNVVILAPNEVSCNGDYKYIQDIYVKNFPKSTFYENFTNHGNKDNIFASLSNDKHLKYKKMIVKLYLKSAIFSKTGKTREILIDTTKKFINAIYESSIYGRFPDYNNVKNELNPLGKGHKDPKWFNKSNSESNLGVEVYTLFGSLAMDVVSRFELGPKNGTNLIENPKDRDIILSHRQVSSMQFWTTLMPRWWDYAATKLIVKSVDDICKFQLKLYKYAEGNKEYFNEPTTLKTLNENGFYNEDAYSFLTDNLFAGHETTASLLTYICYELSRPSNKTVRDKLTQEIIDHFGKPRSKDDMIEDLEKIDHLPYLNAVINENLRVHASIPGAEPRVVDKDYLISELNTVIPKGTIISCLPYAVHRAPQVFPNPDQFIPERWLQFETETKEQCKQRLKLQNKFMMPFGKGIRMCLGMNLAMIEIKLVIANLYWKFNSQIDIDWCNEVLNNDSPIEMDNKTTNENDQQMMKMYDNYTIRPINDECWLKWYSN